MKIIRFSLFFLFIFVLLNTNVQKPVSANSTEEYEKEVNEFMQAYEQMDEEYRKQLNYEEIRNNIDNLRSEFDRWLEGKDSSTTEIDYEEIRKKLDEMTRERKEEKRRIHEYQVAELKAANERMREEMSRHFTRYVTGDGKLIVH